MRRPVPLDRLRDLLAVPERGLTTAEARERRQRHGPNDVVETAGSPSWDLARATARDPMIWFLLGTAALYAAVGERVEAATLAAAILPLVGIDAFLHRRAAASSAGLRSRLAARATVVRDGAPIEVPAAEVVPGDLVIVRAGEPLPADGLLVGGADLQVEESMLTGEAYPVAKRPLPAPGAVAAAVDARHWGFAGTRLLTGQARLRVAYTGAETLYGEIVRTAVGGLRPATPLQAAITSLVAVLVAVASVVCLILAFVRVRQGHGVVDALVSALTLAVAALPEEFPVVFTFFLGVGVYRLARRQALVRRAVSVENVGRISCICSDKTGTVTEGRLELTHLIPVPDVARTRLLALAALAARAETGDPLDAAIEREARTAGPPGPEPLATFPFTEARRRETAVVRAADGALLAATKGAAEAVLDMTALTADERGAWSERVLELAEGGHKVIACAWRPLDAAWPGGEPDRGYRLAGLLAFEDPVRPGVVEAIATCRRAGVHTIMVTGDHPATARAVAREVGLGGGAPRVVSADEAEARIAAGDGRWLRGVDAIARAVPAQKLALVRALQAAGEIVAVTGDGVNDVPALQAADVGIAMGQRGVRSAREAAAIVLVDDNFATIVGAIAEGRQLFRNLRRSFQYLLMIHVPLVVTAALVPLAGYPLLYLPIHIVWLELIIHPTALLAFQDLPAADELARRPPPRAARFFSARDWAAIVAVGGGLTALLVGGYVRALGEGGDVGHARALALAGLTLASALIAGVLTGLRTAAARWLAATSAALSAVLVQTPALAARLHLRPLDADDWALVAAGTLAAVGVPLLAGQLLAPPGPGR
jgi:Ca2+-transporting ATPase